MNLVTIVECPEQDKSTDTRGCIMITLKYALSFLLILHSFFAYAADDAKNYGDMSIEELMNIKVTVASNKPKTARQQPGIVTLITSEDIAHMGARDLVDVFQHVPGISFDNNQYGTTGMSMRGKDATVMLVIIDNMIVNEYLFGSVPLAQHYPISMIDRIEIIRGAGSVRYGGLASVGVIKITTKLAAQKESAASITVGRQHEGSIDKWAEAMYTKKTDSWWGGFLGSFAGTMQSENDFTDASGTKFDMKDNSQIADKFGEAMISNGRFSWAAMLNKYELQDMTNYGVTTSVKVPVTFEQFATRLDYKFQISPHWTLQPFINFKRDVPWKSIGDYVISITGIQYNKSAAHYEGGIHAYYDPSEDVSWLFGLSYSQDVSTDHSGDNFPRTGNDRSRLHDKSVFAEGTHDFDFASITFGARHDRVPYGQATVPRVAAVKEYDTWGYKVLLSRAYRTPTIENVESGDINAPRVEPSMVTMAEVEFSKKLSEESVLFLDLYSLNKEKGIAYFFQITASNPGGNNYTNYHGRDGSEGAELKYQYKDTRNNLQATYSYSNPNGMRSNAEVPDHGDEVRGVPTHKFTLIDTLKIHGDDYYLTPGLVYYSPYHTAEYRPAAGGLTLVKNEEIFLANLVFEKRNFMRENLDVAVGVYNILGEDYRLGVVYPGLQSIGTASREFVLKVSSTF
jgi:outer membrane receptor protein involved in Fe transport